MRKRLLAAWVLTGLGAGLAPPWAPAAEVSSAAVKVKLAVMPLPAPEMLLTSEKMRLRGGVLSPANDFDFKPGTSQHTLDIAGTKVSFALAGNDFVVQTDLGGGPLQKAGAYSFRPAAIRIAKNRTYAMAFPYGYIRKESGTLAYCSSFAMRGTIANQPAMIYDVNCDGLYKAGQDVIRIGNANGACTLAPLAKFIGTPTGVIEILNLAEDGSEIEYRRMSGPVGKLAVSCAADGEFSGAFSSGSATFVATAGGRQVTDIQLPAGDYKLAYGMIYSPRSGKVAATVSLPDAVKVQADTPQKLVLGGPYKIDFHVQVKGDKFNFDDAWMHVRGKAGEEYSGVKYTAVDVGIAVGNKVLPNGKMRFG